jgi:hypothetical protein
MLPSSGEHAEKQSSHCPSIHSQPEQQPEGISSPGFSITTQGLSHGAHAPSTHSESSQQSSGELQGSPKQNSHALSTHIIPEQQG